MLTKEEQKIYDTLKKMWVKSAKYLVKIGEAPNYSALADGQLTRLNETRANKDLTLEENCNNIQLELVNYYKLVRDTNEL